MLKFLSFLFMLVMFSGCGNPESKEQPGARIVAKAGNESLDMEQFQSNYVATGIIKDSLYNAKKSIEAWARESLFYQEAMSKLNADELLIDQQVQEYRKTLVNYIYQTKLVEANLDTNITAQEIEEYYDNHRDNFILRDNIVKVNYLKVPLKAPGLPKIKKLIWSVNEKDKAQLIELCGQNAETFFMNDSTWLFLEDIKKEIPSLRDQPDLNLGSGRVIEFSDDQYYYYLKVKDVKVKNGLSPINFERQNIKKFIINQRKTQLINQYKQMLLEKAKEEKKFSQL